MRLRSAALLLPLLLAALTACHRDTGEAKYPGAPIILISIDTLRSDHLPAYGYKGVETPALDALRKDAILFEKAYSNYPLTLPSHTSLLTGLLPPHNGVRDNVGYTFDAAHHPYLPQLLKNAGYATGAAVSAFVLRKPDRPEQRLRSLRRRDRRRPRSPIRRSAHGARHRPARRWTG